MERVQTRENVRADRNLRKFLTKLFPFTNEKVKPLRGYDLPKATGLLGGKARVECRVENHSVGWKENGEMERSLGTEVMKGNYTTKTRENRGEKRI